MLRTLLDMYCRCKELGELIVEHERTRGQIGGDMYFIRELVALCSFCDTSFGESAEETDTSTC